MGHKERFEKYKTIVKKGGNKLSFLKRFRDEGTQKEDFKSKSEGIKILYKIGFQDTTPECFKANFTKLISLKKPKHYS